MSGRVGCLADMDGDLDNAVIGHVEEFAQLRSCAVEACSGPTIFTQDSTTDRTGRARERLRVARPLKNSTKRPRKA